MAQTPPPVALLGGENAAVSAARSLSRSGVRVSAIGASTDPVRRSRHCASFVSVGARTPTGEDYLEWLDRVPAGTVVLPCDDGGVELVARHRGRLVERGLVPVEGNDDVMLAMLDKARTHSLAKSAGIPVPHSRLVRTTEEADRASREFEFPCALKPLQSHHFAREFGVLAKVFEVDSRESLIEMFERALALGLEMMVTDIVPGGDHRHFSYYSYLDEQGRPLFHFTKHKIRQWPTRFGLTCYQVTDWNPAVAEVGLRFFQGVGLRGVGNVEFKHDPRDGVLKLIECNHRFTAASDLLRHCGVDIPLFTYNRLTGRALPRMEGYRTGVHMWHPIEDVRALREYRAAGTLTTRRWMRTLMHRQHLPLFSLDDPGPSAVSLSIKGRALVRKTKRRVAAALPGRG